jgi:hypothetical protein
MNLDTLNLLLGFTPTLTTAAMFGLAILMGRVAFEPVAEPRYQLRRERPRLRAIAGRGAGARTGARIHTDRDAA